MAQTVNLVSKDNGVGLSVDMGLLEGVLRSAGYDVVRVHWQDPQMRRCDIAVFLELINPQLFAFARSTVGIFNLEWMDHTWLQWLPNFTQLWAKSCDTQAALERRGLTAHYTGFLSRDMNWGTVRRERRCLHLRGHSVMKNTEAVLEAWRRYPDLPHLTVISLEPQPNAPAHVEVLPRQGEQELRWYMNACGVHVCTSRAEGWGHYITEAMTTGNTVITTDASPMSEQVPSSLGFLVRPSAAHQRFLVHEYDVDPDDIADAVRKSVAAFPYDIESKADARRAFVAERNTFFRTRALELLRRLH